MLVTAVNVVSPLEQKYARQLAAEGVQIESELARAGQQPALSMFATGQVDCSTATQFVESLPAPAIAAAEDSLVSAISRCPRQALYAAEVALDNAMKRDDAAPRALLAAIDASGAKSRWAQQAFEAQFASLPKDYEKELKRAPDFAALFQRMAEDAPHATIRKAGLDFLEWLSKIPEGSERNMAINAVTDTMQHALGDAEYQDALSSNVIARDTAKLAGQPGGISGDEEESVSVMGAMSSGSDQSAALENLMPSARARQAAAFGFSANAAGDRKLADRYFDQAYAVAEDVWRDRKDDAKASDVIREVSEAAAQVDAVAALQRAQKLEDPTAQAISMLAVARVVLGQAHP